MAMTDEEAATRLTGRLAELTETAARLRVGSPSYYGVRPEVLLEIIGAAEAEAEAISIGLRALRVKGQLVEALEASGEQLGMCSHNEGHCDYCDDARELVAAALKAAKETP